MSVNRVILIGRLGQDPTTRYMPNGEAVTNVSLATSESWKDKAGEKQEKVEWHNLIFFRRLAEVAGEYLKKGSQIYIEGKLQTRKWEKDGVTRYTTEVIVNEMTMLGGKPSGESNESAGQPSQNYDSNPVGRPGGTPEKKPESKSSFYNFSDDIPF